MINDRYFYFVIIADTHIIDDYYRGPESNHLDSESILKANERLRVVRDHINTLPLPIEMIFLVGDYVHGYPSTNWGFYFANKTRFDHAKMLTDMFTMPVYINFGNHDYAVPRLSREFTHELFKAKFHVLPYYTVDHKGWKFVQLNNFLGETWNPTSTFYNPAMGSLGEEQLAWLDAHLSQGRPSFVLIHFPLIMIQRNEYKNIDLYEVLKKHRDTVQCVISGHWHRWMELSAGMIPPQLVVGATRYDVNAYVIVEIDTVAQKYRFLNRSQWGWFTHYSKPFPPVKFS